MRSRVSSKLVFFPPLLCVCSLRIICKRWDVLAYCVFHRPAFFLPPSPAGRIYPFFFSKVLPLLLPARVIAHRRGRKPTHPFTRGRSSAHACLRSLSLQAHTPLGKCGMLKAGVAKEALINGGVPIWIACPTREFCMDPVSQATPTLSRSSSFLSAHGQIFCCSKVDVGLICVVS